jgi:hypothetical protein
MSNRILIRIHLDNFSPVIGIGISVEFVGSSYAYFLFAGVITVLMRPHCCGSGNNRRTVSLTSVGSMPRADRQSTGFDGPAFKPAERSVKFWRGVAAVPVGKRGQVRIYDQLPNEGNRRSLGISP